MRLEIASDSRKGNILCSCQIQCSATDFHQLLSLHPPRVCAGAHPHIPPPEKVISRQPDLCQIGDNDCSSAPLQAFASPLLHLPVWIPFHKPFPTPYSVFWNDNLFFPLWAEVAPGAWRRNWRAALPLYIGCCSQFNLIKILPVVEFILLRSCLETRWQRFATAWSSVNLFSFCFCMYLFLIESSCFRVHEVPFSRVLQAAKRSLEGNVRIASDLDGKCMEYLGVQPTIALIKIKPKNSFLWHTSLSSWPGAHLKLVHALCMLSANPVKNVMAAKRILFIVLGCSGSASLGGEGVQAFSDTLSPAGSRLLMRRWSRKDGHWKGWPLEKMGRAGLPLHSSSMECLASVCWTGSHTLGEITQQQCWHLSGILFQFSIGSGTGMLLFFTMTPFLTSVKGHCRACTLLQ